MGGGKSVALPQCFSAGTCDNSCMCAWLNWTSVAQLYFCFSGLRRGRLVEVGGEGGQESPAECQAAASLTFKAETRTLSIPTAPLVAGREAH